MILFFLIGYGSASLGGEVYNPQPQEKVYLHFDNTGYFLTETIWFKAYVLDESNKLSAISNVLYVELVSPEGGVVRTDKYKLENGMCCGDFYLDSVYLSGFYEVRAYTRYMRNFGTDNYFSRVFPVYDAVRDGDYGLRAMCVRSRNESLRKENGGRQARKKDMSSDILPYGVRDAIGIVSRYNALFSPRPIVLCDSLRALSPGESVELVFRTVPHSVFSLSVTDEDSRIATCYNGDIHKDLYQDSSWVERGYRAMRAFDKEQNVYFQPEKDITIDGDVISRSRFRGRLSYHPDVLVHCTMREDSLLSEGEMRTDSAGRWSFTVDDFYGSKRVRLYALLFHQNEPALRVHKWFSPEPREYRADETVLPWKKDDYDGLYPESADGKQGNGIHKMQEVVVNAKRRRQRDWKELKRSLVHYSYAEEVEYYADHEPGAMCHEPISIATSIFGRYHYPIKAARWMVADAYENDRSIPVGRVHDRWGDLSKQDIKEVVVRTDYATCHKYDYSSIGYPDKSGTSTGMGITGWNHNPSNVNDHLCYVVCFIPYTQEEKRSVNLMKTGTIKPLSRYTVVKGFTRPSSFVAMESHDSVQGDSTDFRRTLYWDPMVCTDENGVAKVTFHNNSTCRTLHISAEGISTDGFPLIYK